MFRPSFPWKKKKKRKAGGKLNLPNLKYLRFMSHLVVVVALGFLLYISLKAKYLNGTFFSVFLFPFLFLCLLFSPAFPYFLLFLFSLCFLSIIFSSERGEERGGRLIYSSDGLWFGRREWAFILFFHSFFYFSTFCCYIFRFIPFFTFFWWMKAGQNLYFLRTQLYRSKRSK